MKENFLNTDIPEIQCFVRAEFLYDGKARRGKLVPVVAFGLSSIYDRALGFMIMTNGGAVIDRVPIHALCWKRGAPDQTLRTLQLWDCFSYYPSVHRFKWMQGLRCKTLLGDRDEYLGTYLFTVDWAGSQESEAAGDIGHKSAHVLALDNGNFAAQPNNRIFWKESAFVTNPITKNPGYKINTRIWSCEDGEKFTTADSDQFFYK